MAIEKNVSYVRHCINLHARCNSTQNCFESYITMPDGRLKQDIARKTAGKSDTRLCIYMPINDSLTSPDFYSNYILPESDRRILTKYRSGTYFLRALTRRRRDNYGWIFTYNVTCTIMPWYVTGGKVGNS